MLPTRRLQWANRYIFGLGQQRAAKVAIKKPALSRSSIFVHCGLHKTATTTIQRFCQANRNVLLEQGTLYPESDEFDAPETSELRAAHHNLAWEVAGDRRFRPGAFTLDKMMTLSSSFAGNILVSREDFESVLHRHETMLAFTQRLAETGKAVYLILYVRDLQEYKQSLYLELLKHGYSEPFHVFETASRSGRIKYREWVFQLDYDDLVADLARLSTVKVVCRPYVKAAPSGAAVTDFMSVLGIEVDSLCPSVSRIVNASRAPADNLAAFCSARLHRTLAAPEMSVIAALCDHLALFGESSLNAPAGSDPGRLDRVFSDRTVELIAAAGDLEEAAIKDQCLELKAWWGDRSAATMPLYVDGDRS